MEGAVASLGEAVGLSLKLREKAIERDAARGENAQVSVHGQDEFIGIQCRRCPYRDGFLPHAAEPLRNFALPQLAHHFLLNHAREHELREERFDGVIRAISAVKGHGVKGERGVGHGMQNPAQFKPNLPKLPPPTRGLSSRHGFDRHQRPAYTESDR